MCTLLMVGYLLFILPLNVSGPTAGTEGLTEICGVEKTFVSIHIINIPLMN